jgi:cytochrome P450
MKKAPSGSAEDEDRSWLHYDLTDQSLAENPHPLWAELRRAPAIRHSSANEGFWAMAKYEDVVYASNHRDVFCSGQGVAIPELPYPPLLPIESDPPLHMHYRRILNPWLSPRRAKEAEPQIRRHAVGLLNALEGKDRFDYAVEFAQVLPQLITLDLLKIPDERRADLTGWVESILRHRDDVERTTAASAALLGYVTELLAERRQNPIPDDVLSATIAGEVDGRPMTDEELLMTTVLLINAGLDTTGMAISVAVWHLAQHPELRDRLRTEPGLFETVIEEYLRWISPVPFEGRTVTEDTQYGGCPMKAGDKVALLLGSANRDETVFPDAHEFVPDRYPNRHLAFGIGAHRCLGSNLARIALRVSIEELLVRIPDFHVDGELMWVTSETRGLHRLPLARGR